MALRAPGPAPAERALVTPACGTSAGACEVGDALRLVSKAHVLDLLHLLSGPRPLRFNEIRRMVRANANVVSLRLKDLADAGLARRIERASDPPHVEYVATQAGIDLLASMEPLRAWAARHPPPPRT